MTLYDLCAECRNFFRAAVLRGVKSFVSAGDALSRGGI